MPQVMESKAVSVLHELSPPISGKSVKKLHEKMKEWKLHSHLGWKLQQVGIEIESQVRGWYNYYNKFGKTEFVKVMNHLNMVLAY